MTKVVISAADEFELVGEVAELTNLDVAQEMRELAQRFVSTSAVSTKLRALADRLDKVAVLLRNARL